MSHYLHADPGGGLFLSPSGGAREARHCPGCADHPPLTCACCGDRAVRAVVDPDFACAVTYCAACFAVLLAARRYFAAHRVTPEMRVKMAQRARETWARRRALADTIPA